MKIAGWIITSLGTLSLLGCLLKGSSPFGPLVWLGVGIFMLYRANQKEKELQELKNWKNK